ncbi:MAG: hypothetical protein OEO21_00095 [Candidatus Krumholzibacteria bacterium]|nr:hypothetical protein [Candidatus Krumholzibacteria bacterium]
MIDVKKLVLVPALAFTLVLLLPGTAQVQSPLIGQMELNYYEPNPIWRGTITGDISGEIFFSNIGGKEAGMAYHFEEEWWITDQGGTILRGTDEGVVSPNSKYRMNGVVTEAAPEWSHLIGRKVHASGYITWDPDTGAPLTAPGTFRIE